MFPSAVDVIIKVGGSAVTEKNNFETAKLADIQKAVEIVKECRCRKLKCIIVHGAGSFGHHQAKEFGVNKGWTLSESDMKSRVLEGFVKTHQSVTKPCGTWVTKHRKVLEDGVVIVTRLLEAGFIPIMHGDCVLDQGQGCCILSGDTIIEVLCEKLLPSRVVFLSDVQGVYDAPPHLPNSRLLRDINVSPEGCLDIEVATCMPNIDVTGGIQLKLDTAILIITKSQGHIPVFVCSISSEGAVQACCHGNLHGKLGTEFHFKK